MKGIVVWSLSHVWLFYDPMGCIARQAPLSIEFPRQEYWNGLPFPAPGYLPNPGMKPTSPLSPALQADTLPLSHPRSSRKELVKTKKIRGDQIRSDQSLSRV